MGFVAINATKTRLQAVDIIAHYVKITIYVGNVTKRVFIITNLRNSDR